MKQSTRDILKRHGWRLDRAVHNFCYFYFHKHYVTLSLLVARTGSGLLSWLPPFKHVPLAVFNRYHSKVLSATDVNKILTLDQDIDLGVDRDKSVIPFKFANRVLFRNPQLIAVMDCPCKLNQPAEKRCEPLNVCMAVGQDFAPIWLEHCKEKYNARQVTQEEAREIIAHARSTGHVTQAFLKVATGGITGIICSCCPDCCAGMMATKMCKKIDETITQYVGSGYSVARDEALCTLCGVCEQACPFDLVTIADGRYAYDQPTCLGCGLCVDKCPQQALSLFRDPDKLMPLDIELLQEQWKGASDSDK